MWEPVLGSSPVVSVRLPSVIGMLRSSIFSVALVVAAANGAAAYAFVGGVAAPRVAVASTGRVLAHRMQADEDSLADLFGQALKQQKKEDTERKQEERRNDQRKIRPGPRLDLENRPQNFFRGLAERDERLAQQPDLERATLMSNEDAKVWIGGIALIAAVVGANVAYSAFEEQAYQAAVDDGNYALVRCLDTAFSFSEKNICRLKG